MTWLGLRALLSRSWPAILALLVVIAALFIRDRFVAAERRADNAVAERDKARGEVKLRLTENQHLVSVIRVQNDAIGQANAAFQAQEKRVASVNREIVAANAAIERARAAIDARASRLIERPAAPPDRAVEAARASLKDTKGFDYVEMD